jgi:hypothetical protein
MDDRVVQDRIFTEVPGRWAFSEVPKYGVPGRCAGPRKRSHLAPFINSRRG